MIGSTQIPELWSSLSPTAEEEFRKLAAAMSDQLEEVSAQVTEEIVATIPELGGEDERVHRLLDEAILANLGALASMLRYGITTESVEVPRRSVQFANVMAHRGLGVAPLLRAWRFGHGLTWAWWLRLLSDQVDDKELLAELTAWSAKFLLAYVDAVSEQMVAILLEEQERWQRSRMVSRDETVRRLVAGESIETDEASRRLRYELARHHVAAIVAYPVDRASPDDIAELEKTAKAISRHLAVESSLTVAVDGATIWAWFSSYNRFDPARLEALEEVDLGRPAHIALGNAGFGLEGFCASHDQAKQALRVAWLRSTPAGAVTSYRSVSLAAVLCADPAAAHMFARAVLGPLDDDSSTAARLRETVGAYLSEGSSYARAARRLGVHEKTVMYRVRQAGELLGRQVGECHAALEAALLVRSVLGRGAVTDRADVTH